MTLLPGALAGAEPTGPDAAELRRIGDRLVAFAALLPREPGGPVGLLVAEPLAAALLGRFPGAVRVDGSPAPTAEPFALVVVEEAVADPAAARELLAPDGTLVVLGRQGSHVIYPDLHAPQQVWRRGWPLPGALGPRADVRRRAGVLLHRWRGLPRLDVQGTTGRTLADEVAAEVGAALGDRFTVVGLVAAGHTVLRLRGRSGDVAVRLSSSDPDSDPLRSEVVRAEVPEVSDLLPEVLAHGRIGEMPWVATPWLPDREVPVLDAGRRARSAPVALRRLADTLAARPTGWTGPGWAAGWVAAATLVPAGQREGLTEALSVLEGHVRTGWCHGDPWAGNVVLGADGPRVIDWDTADRQAPLGLDRLLLAALAHTAREEVDLATACAAVARRPELLPEAVGGRDWSAWSPRERAALALSAFLLNLRNRALHDLGEDRLRAGLATMTELVAPAPIEEPAAPAGDLTRGAGRGVLWLGAGAVVSKGYQTIIQLVLAAVLAPAALGVLAVGALITNIISTLTDMGSSTALVHWRGDPAAPARSALTIGLLTSLVATGAGWVGAPWLASTLGVGHDGVGVIRGLLLTVPLYAIAGVSLELMRRDLAFARRVMPDIVSAVVGLGVSLVLVFRGAGVYALVDGQIAQAVVRLLACWVLVRPVRPGWSRAHVRSLLAYGRHLAGANAVQLLMLNVDYLLVGHLLGGGPLGEYSLAFRLAYMPHILVTVVVCGAAFPYLCRIDSKRIGAAVSRFAWLTALVVCPVYLGMGLLAPALELLGPQWSPAVPVVRWLAGYGVLLGAVQVAQTSFNALGRTRTTFLLNLVHLLLLATLLAVLVEHGISAAGAAQALAGGAVVLLAFVLLQRALPGQRFVAPGRDVLVGLLGLVALAATQVVLRPVLPAIEHSVWALVVAGAAMVLAYAGVLVLGFGRDRAVQAARMVMER